MAMTAGSRKVVARRVNEVIRLQDALDAQMTGERI